MTKVQVLDHYWEFTDGSIGSIFPWDIIFNLNKHINLWCERNGYEIPSIEYLPFNITESKRDGKNYGKPKKFDDKHKGQFWWKCVQINEDNSWVFYKFYGYDIETTLDTWSKEHKEVFKQIEK